MSKKLAPYGDIEHYHIAKVGSGNKMQTPRTLAARMPSLDIASKVGLPPDLPKIPAPESLASRMPSQEIAAKVGFDKKARNRPLRVVRRNAAN